MTNRKFSRLERRFHSIAHKLATFDLQRLGSSDKASFSIHDVVANLHDHSGSSLFMGFYTAAGLMEVLERYGIAPVLRKKGFQDLHLRIDTDNPFRHVFQLYWGKEGDPERLLGEAVLHEAIVTPKAAISCASYDVVFIEWLWG